MNPSDAIEAIEKPLSSLPYSLSRHILEHLRKLTSHEPVIGIMGKSGAGKSSLCNALFQGEVTPVSDVHAGTREVRRFRLSGHGHSMVITDLPGVGESREMTPGERSLIQRALKTLDRHLHEPGVAFTSTRAAREWLILNMAGLEREEFRVLYLNNQNQLIAGETLFTGTINRTEVHPREVIKRALYHNAAAVVLAHNHPSGEVTPSKADRLITERLVQALGLVDIRVPDHLIVGGSQVFSFAEYGLL